MTEKENNRTKTAIVIILSIAFAALFMWLALRGLNFDKIKQSLSKANYLWVMAAFVFGLLAYWVRAIRWNLLLEPMGYKISNSNALWSLSFGYLMNLTIPRSGELARSTALYGVEKVPVERSFGTIILERIVDLLCMLMFLILTLVFKYEAFLAFYNLAVKQKENQQTVSDGNATSYIFIGIVILSVLLTILFRKKIQQWSIFGKVLNFGKGLLTGLKTIFNLKNKSKFIFLSLAIWICYYLAAYLVCFALPQTSDFNLADGFFIIVVGTLGMIVPASGGIGAFHFALKLGVMALYLSMGKNPEEGGEVGLTYAFISHTMQLVIMLMMGIISIPMLARSRKQLG